MHMFAVSEKMKINSVIVIVLLKYMIVCACASLPQDTYVDALQNSHNIEHETDKEAYQYSPPHNSYLPPVPSAPGPVYGLSPIQLYNSPPPVFYKPSNPIPYNAHESFLAKLKSKLNILTLGKIILKLLIFKKIVKFIGIICLLLVLPKLKNMFNDSMTMEDQGMNSKHVETEKDILDKQINEAFQFIKHFIQDFEEENTK